MPLLPVSRPKFGSKIWTVWVLVLGRHGAQAKAFFLAMLHWVMQWVPVLGQHGAQAKAFFLAMLHWVMQSVCVQALGMNKKIFCTPLFSACIFSSMTAGEGVWLRIGFMCFCVPAPAPPQTILISPLFATKQYNGQLFGSTAYHFCLITIQ